MVNIKPIISKYLPKAVGLGTLCLVASDAHIIGKLEADKFAKSKDADACQKWYNNTRVMNTPSTTLSKLKDTVFRIEMEDNTRNFVNSATGYVKGLGAMLVSSVIPFTLGIGALFAKNKSVAKGSAIGLGLYGALCLFKDVLGFGHNNDLNKKF